MAWLWPGGEVANTAVCKTAIHGCNSRPGLVYLGAKLRDIHRVLVDASFGIRYYLGAFKGVFSFFVKTSVIQTGGSPSPLFWTAAWLLLLYLIRNRGQVAVLARVRSERRVTTY